MRKSISVISEVEDKWEKVPKDKFTDKQRKYFFSVGAMRQGKVGDGYVEVNYSKLPKKPSVNEAQEYDSTVDARLHIEIIHRVMEKIISELSYREMHHDDSKFVEPELSTYNKYIPLLKETPFGSKEYVEVRDKMYNDGLKHHFENNRHHPEHFENGIKDMTLVDVVEMFCDWYAASQRSDTGFEDGLKFNKDKFKMSDELYRVFKNTYEEYFK